MSVNVLNNVTCLW